MCVMCRGKWERDEVMNVYMSETARWDALIDVAQAFSAMDRRGEEETSEEENDEDFIDDRSGVENASEQQKSARDPSSDLPELTDEGSERGTPERYTRHSFSESPMKDKRRRLERLAEERLSKRTRI
ncbi:hypothetical protein AX15_007226 [Amanita polypyramis BW_CC]|nr:hypothetical protein AX15_007226 [Amanita polypyramis BW_CC]